MNNSELLIYQASGGGTIKIDCITVLRAEVLGKRDGRGGDEVISGEDLSQSNCLCLY
ncbi:MAG: hypothetical protein NT163_06555 [Chlorobiales bacterium]|nr:hypothetical protein [Chlorobiales bacterium]